MAKRVAVFVAWPYANGPLHVGHVGGSLLPPDIFARYHRLKGHSVVMVSGSDTHGTPITARAEEEGTTPREVYRHWHRSFITTFQRLGISFDLFTHTDTPGHHAVAGQVFEALRRAGHLFTGTAPQLYAPSQGRYLPDRFVEGTCPHCGYTGARGDQCDQCGRLLDATELIDPRARFGTGEALEVHEREHYFLDLPAFADRLEGWLSAQSDWRPSVRNSALGQIKEGLRPRPITRDLDWGVQVPVPGWEKRVLYVWFEAVVGYLSGSIELALTEDKPDDWRITWNAESTDAYYFMGKDNIPFHTVIWPAMLMGLGQFDPTRPDSAGDHQSPLALPTDVVSNEFVNLEGQAMSTSRNFAVWIPDFLDSYDPDPLRYALAINAPETKDVDFTWEDFVRRNNDELLATWGNLVNRVMRLTHSAFDGVVPEPGPLGDLEAEILALTAGAFDRVGAEIEARRFRAALAEAMGVAHDVNRYLNTREPWQAVKSDRAGAGTTLFVALQAISDLATVLAPFLPHTSEKVRSMLGASHRLFGDLSVVEAGTDADAHPVLRYQGDPGGDRWQSSRLQPGAKLAEPEVIVVKLDAAEVVARERARLGLEPE